MKPKRILITIRLLLISITAGAQSTILVLPPHSVVESGNETSVLMSDFRYGELHYYRAHYDSLKLAAQSFELAAQQLIDSQEQAITIRDRLIEQQRLAADSTNRVLMDVDSVARMYATDAANWKVQHDHQRKKSRRMQWISGALSALCLTLILLP